MDLRRTILLLRSFPKLLLIISTITITTGFKLKQNGCLPLNSGKHPCLNLNYSFFIQCPENWVHIKFRGRSVIYKVRIRYGEAAYIFSGTLILNMVSTLKMTFLTPMQRPGGPAGRRGLRPGCGSCRRSGGRRWRGR